MSKFEVGQRAKINKYGSALHGVEVEVMGIDRDTVRVKFSNNFEYRYIPASDLTPADSAPRGSTASAGDGGVFDLIERRIMKSGDIRYLEGINEPIGLETAKYINNQSMALHDANQARLVFAGQADDLRAQIATLQAQLTVYAGQVAQLTDELAVASSWSAHVTDPAEQLKWAEIAIREAQAAIATLQSEVAAAQERERALREALTVANELLDAVESPSPKEDSNELNAKMDFAYRRYFWVAGTKIRAYQAAQAQQPGRADGYAVGQEVILLDGTSLVGRVIEVGSEEFAGELMPTYKVSLNGSEGRWYTAGELAAYNAGKAQDTAS